MSNLKKEREKYLEIDAHELLMKEQGELLKQIEYEKIKREFEELNKIQKLQSQQQQITPMAFPLSQRISYGYNTTSIKMELENLFKCHHCEKSVKTLGNSSEERIEIVRTIPGHARTKLCFHIDCFNSIAGKEYTPPKGNKIDYENDLVQECVADCKSAKPKK